MRGWQPPVPETPETAIPAGLSTPSEAWSVRDEMFVATDTPWAPWFVARSEDKKSVRLNVLTHLLKQIPYKEVKQPKVKLPKRKIGSYETIDYPFKYVAESF